MDDSSIILISYPAGGFGHFIFHALTCFASNTFKVDNDFNFSYDGNSHQTKKYTPLYYKDPATYQLNIPDPNKKTLVLCDNGIENDSYHNIRKIFPTAKIIRMCITESVRPVVYQTLIIKASQSSLMTQLGDHIKLHWDDADEPHAAREIFTITYRNWLFKWEPVEDVINVELEQLITRPVNTITELIEQIGGQVIDPEKLVGLCEQWQQANQKYFKIYYDWQKINQALDCDLDVSIDDITDLHSQGYINYCVERKFNVTIPVVDYRSWFTSTRQIKEMIECLKSNH